MSNEMNAIILPMPARSAAPQTSDGRNQEPFRWLEHVRPVAFLVLLSLLLALPVLRYGAADLSNDGLDHARWARVFSEQFWAGEFYPRWFSNVNAGLGSPSFFFYPPLPSYVAALFWPVMHSWDPNGWFMAGYSYVLALSISGVAAYFWLRSLGEIPAAVLGAVVYLIAPYHLGINLYNRGALAEFWLFAWLPLVLLSAEGILSRSRFALPGLIVSYALSVFAHPTVAACCGVLPIAYVLFVGEGKDKVRAALQTGVGLVLGIGLTAGFLLPAWVDQPKSYASMQVSGWGDFRNWWLFQIRDKIAEVGVAATGIPWYLGYKARILVIVLWMLAVTGCLFWLVRRFGSAGRTRGLALFYLSMAVISFFLMLKQSAFLWETIVFLRFLQLPHRLNTVLVISAAAMATLAFPFLRRPGAGMFRYVLILSLLGWLGMDAVFASQAFSAWRRVPQERLARTDYLMMRRKDYFSFWPKQSPMEALNDQRSFERFLSAHPPKTLVLSDPSAGTVTIRDWKPREIVVNTDLSKETVLTINHFYFEGWQSRISGNKEMTPVVATKPDGLMEIRLPGGNHELVVELPLDKAKRNGRAIALACLAASGLLLGWAASGRIGNSRGDRT